VLHAINTAVNIPRISERDQLHPLSLQA
jgi:hypothetical protein